IGRYERPGKLVRLDARAALRLGKRDISEFLKKRVGDSVQRGEAIAVRPRIGGLFPRALLAPASGRLVAMSDSQILLESDTEEAEVRAHISGRIVSVMPERGAVIETAAALVQGAWGTGEMSHGVLRAVLESPEDVLSEDKVDVSCLGAIVIGGADATEEGLVQVGKMQARGLILGGLSGYLLETAASLSFPVIITEGFGRCPMNPFAFDILKSHIGHEAAVDPGCADPWRARRPEVIIPIPVSAVVASESQTETLLREGCRVRVVRGDRRGLAGVVTALPEHPVRYEIGVSLPSAEIQADSGDLVLVPVNNLEIIG
ncbi:MAG: hypothetical protein QHH80_09875, partial [Anaerolineae bacterium]|nr:hypothetical protein [Anaerolineae bacterium]